jgi:hypothetical protein
MTLTLPQSINQNNNFSAIGASQPGDTIKLLLRLVKRNGEVDALSAASWRTKNAQRH